MVIESTMQSGKSRSGALTHHVASEDPLDLEYPTYVSEVAWKWHDPDEENTPCLREVPGEWRHSTVKM